MSPQHGHGGLFDSLIEHGFGSKGFKTPEPWFF